MLLVANYEKKSWDFKSDRLLADDSRLVESIRRAFFRVTQLTRATKP
jgi:hypothetical protein